MAGHPAKLTGDVNFQPCCCILCQFICPQLIGRMLIQRRCYDRSNWCQKNIVALEDAIEGHRIKNSRPLAISFEE